jgi:hypothetical protein
MTKTIVIFALVWTISNIVYNLYFHPLSSYPGPFLGRAFNVYISILEMRGTQHTEVKKWHDTYGEVVRIAPNTLSYNSGQAWEEICGKPPPLFFGELEYDIDSNNVKAIGPVVTKLFLTKTGSFSCFHQMVSRVLYAFS